MIFLSNFCFFRLLVIFLFNCSIMIDFNLDFLSFITKIMTYIDFILKTTRKQLSSKLICEWKYFYVFLELLFHHALRDFFSSFWFCIGYNFYFLLLVCEIYDEFYMKILCKSEKNQSWSECLRQRQCQYFIINAKQ